MRPLRDVRVAGSFLTRVPLHVDGEIDMARATPWFPGVGLMIGVAGAAVFAAADEVLPSGPAASLALVATALITGAFHHDGLADIADGFGGGWDREQRLAILKDSRHGTYGVVSLVLLIAVQWSALASLPRPWAIAGLICAHMLGRAAILGVLLAARPARPEGLGTDYSAGLRRPACLAAMLVAIALGAVLAGPWIGVPVLLVAVTSLTVVALAYRKIGGISGDVLGATEQLGEAVVLLGIAAIADTGRLPWWR